MSTIESQIQKLNDTNAELARVNNELTSAVRTHTNDINNEVAAAKNTMAAATASAISEVKADANAVNAEIKARMDDAVVPWLPAMTKVQFDALRADRKQQYAGSGFVEWGKHSSVYEINANINEGMFCASYNGESSRYSKLTIGSKLGSSGQSSTEFASVLVDGVTLRLSDSRVDVYGIHCTFPEAPDGTKTYDSATGTVTQHTNAEVAFAAETATNKVITSRKDLVFLESWHEKIADKDVVYPLGNVQYGASSYEGVSLLNNLVAQGYSAFGEWDENTQGYGAKWSSLTDAQKALFLSEPEHNIYYDAEAKIYVQVRYRIRVVEGVSDDWNELRPSVHEITTEWAIANRRRITFVQGSDLSISSTVFVMKGHTQTTLTKVDMGIAEGEARTFGRASFGSTKPLALPIAVVQRMNQGAYHPTYNPMGTRRWNTTGVWANYNWYHPRVLAATNTATCFQITIGNPANNDDNGAFINSGYINSSHGSGRQDQYKFYDAIYAGQVEDLRLNANKLDVNKLREDSILKAVAGTLRGKGSLPKLRIQTFEKNGGFFNNGYWMGKDGNAQFALGADFDSWHTQPWLNSFNRNQPLRGRAFGACYIVRHDNNAVIRAEVTDGGTTGQNIYCSAEVDVPDGTTISIIMYDTTSPEFDSLPWTDIVGYPERIAATFPDGVVGQWVPQLPNDETDQLFTANRKSLSHPSVNALRTMDNGETWQAITSAVNEKNQIKDTWNTQSVGLVHYETLSHFTNLADNAQIVGTTGNVYQGNFHQIDRGNRLNSSVSGVIAKQGSTHKGVGFLSTNSFTYESWSIAPLKLTAAAQPEHQRVDLASGNESGAMKTLPTITEKNGLYYLQLHGAELKHHKPTFTDVNPSSNTTYTAGNFYRLTNYGAKGYYVCEVTKTFAFYTNTDYIQMESGDIVYGPTNQVVLRKLNTADGSSWGDDQTIPIVNGEDVKTDLNGNTVKVFCHHSQIPLGIAHND
ncbi:hypothetical protein [Pseudoalteromonas aurantia]|uniref:Uncharacterized protein n=1 Tax=Pseudoalteromonas aurantia TaxID=43654 RepID=A0A5S3V6X6_9GAMM|nr:hypothetical protein [Pseudoalteromonas aurantia]TMO67469.1 hypothetical protein CWC19_13700 [Pseudoalteromonas aurantia]